MSDLRTAAQQALEALALAQLNGEAGLRDYEVLEIAESAVALEAALAEPVQEPVAWYFEARHIDSAWAAAVTLKHPGAEGVYMRNVKPLYTAPPRCPNCASLQDQNTELDRKLADLEQTSLELCKTCGWRTLIPGEGCLNCARSKQAVQEPVTWRWGYRSITTGEMDWRGYVEIPSHPNLRSPAIIMEPLYTAPPQRKPLETKQVEQIMADCFADFADKNMPTNWWQWSLRNFARAIERAHEIGGQP